ncbi:MAG: ion transporter [Phycisphaeraceae bacterium]|nr:MAG: ion transporter [Phycisphaeraceae bacterium]
MLGPNPDAPPPQVAAWRDRLHEIIFEADTPTGKAFDLGLIVLIVASVAVVVLGTLPSMQQEPYHTVFIALEWMFTGLFTIEYILRLIIVRRPWRYATSFFGIIDLLSILPAFIGIIVPGGGHLLVVRTLRLLRIFRVLKLARYLSGASELRKALYVSRHKIAVFLTTVLIVVLISSALMHVVEGSNGTEGFESMPDAMYWAVITMTTVGYGDVTPETPIGKITTAALVLVGYSLIIVPTGILTAEITHHAGRRVITTRACPSCMTEGHDANAIYCKRCGQPLDPEHTPPAT